MPYAILRFAKMKGGPAKALEAHHERKKEKYNSNPDIDTNKCKQNYHLIAPEKSYYYEIQSRIEKVGCKVRKDSIKFVDTIITASPEFFSGSKPEKAELYFTRALDFLEQEVGKENIFSATVHMDERTPHMHICFVPLTTDKRLSAKEIIGNRSKLVEWQDKFHAYMSAAFQKLERGEPACETKRKHVSVQLFKQATSLTAKMEEIQNLMDGMNILNMSKKREELIKELGAWLPKVRSFNKWIKQVQSGNEELKRDIEALKDENKQLGEKAWDCQNKWSKAAANLHNLSNDYRELVDFHNSIPEDLRKDLYKKFQNLQNMDKEKGWEMEL